MPDSNRTALEKAVATLARPLVRLVLRRGMAYGELTEILKRAYVDVARHELAMPGKKATISRIAVLTGLTRKEASRLVAEAADDSAAETRGRVNRAARVLSGWVQDAEFLDAAGEPAALPFESKSGPSVSELVRRHGADVPARAVIDELIRVGAVVADEEDRYRPVERAYVPRVDDDEMLAIFGTDVADLIASIDHNLTDADAPPFYQRKVAYDNLPADFLPRLQKRVRAEAQKLLERLDADMSRQDRDLNPDEGPGGHRAMVGIYYYEEEKDESRES